VRLFLALRREKRLKDCMATSVSRDSGQGKRKLLDRVRETIRFKHYSLRTEQAYVGWIKRFILFHGKRHPESMGAEARWYQWPRTEFIMNFLVFS
jgi:hypothetical protein